MKMTNDVVEYVGNVVYCNEQCKAKKKAFPNTFLHLFIFMGSIKLAERDMAKKQYAHEDGWQHYNRKKGRLAVNFIVKFIYCHCAVAHYKIDRDCSTVRTFSC